MNFKFSLMWQLGSMKFRVHVPAVCTQLVNIVVEYS